MIDVIKFYKKTKVNSTHFASIMIIYNSTWSFESNAL